MLSTARVSPFAPILAPRAGRRSLTVRAATVNPDIKKDVDKVVDFVAVPSDLGDKKSVSYCRCWRSKTFPLCDGGHVAHNKDTGDNVGPLVIKQD
ncbi:hypothetical protein ABPG77_004626 [Micractinium sp. CCAP 211/92]